MICQVWDPYLLCSWLLIKQVVIKYVLFRDWSYGRNKERQSPCLLGFQVHTARWAIQK